MTCIHESVRDGTSEQCVARAQVIRDHSYLGALHDDEIISEKVSKKQQDEGGRERETHTTRGCWKGE